MWMCEHNAKTRTIGLNTSMELLFVMKNLSCFNKITFCQKKKRNTNSNKQQQYRGAARKSWREKEKRRFFACKSIKHSLRSMRTYIVMHRIFECYFSSFENLKGLMCNKFSKLFALKWPSLSVSILKNAEIVLDNRSVKSVVVWVI